MNTDIRIKVSFPHHHKTKKLKRLLGAEGVLSLLTLWVFAAQNKPDGIFTGMDDDDIELAADWEGDAGSMLTALLKVNFAERDDNGIVRLHDWEENNPYASGAKERSQRAKTAARARWESHKKQEVNANRMQPALLPAQNSNAPSPSPLPSPVPLPVQKEKDIVSFFQIRIDDLSPKYPLVNVEKVKFEIVKWLEKHPNRREDDIKVNQKIIDIMEHEQNRAEKRSQLADVFESLWSQYPKKDGDKKKVRHKIERQITTEQDISGIQNAFTNYMEHVRIEREGGFPDLKYKGRETWFNNWRSWVDWESPAIETRARSAFPISKQGAVHLAMEETERRFREQAERERMDRANGDGWTQAPRSVGPSLLPPCREPEDDS